MPSCQPSIADVVIRRGDTPQRLLTPIAQGVLYQVDRNQFLFRVPDVGRILVEDGSRIIVDSATDTISPKLEFYLLSSCWGALLHQRGLLCLHASAFKVKEGAAVLLGRSGSGKSTILAALLKRGYSMLSDDLTVVEPVLQSTPIVYPGSPSYRIWPDAVTVLSLEPQRQCQTEVESFKIDSGNQFHPTALPLSNLIILDTHKEREIRVDRLKPLDGLSSTLKSTYSPGFIAGEASESNRFQKAATISSNISVTQILRPESRLQPQSLEKIVETLINTLQTIT